MRRFAALILTGIVFAAARDAAAQGAFPPPLERIVDESILIVTGRLKTHPVHCGDVYELDVDEMLKGAAPSAPLKVAAPWYFTGCEHTANEPLPAAIEATSKRVLLFVTEMKDGVAQVRETVKLDPDQGRSVPLGSWAVARVGLAAVRALVRLDDPATDAKQGAALWIEGFKSENLLLVEAMLDRLAPAASPEEHVATEYCQLGETLVIHARRDLAASRPEILAAAFSWCAHAHPTLREKALACALAVRRAGKPDETAMLAPTIAAARDSSRSKERWVRETSIRLLVVADDAEACPAIVDALRRNDDDFYAMSASVDLARDLALRKLERRDAVLGELIALLDRPVKGAVCAMDGLAKITGRKFDDAAGWKAWWAFRKK